MRVHDPCSRSRALRNRAVVVLPEEEGPDSMTSPPGPGFVNSERASASTSAKYR